MAKQWQPVILALSLLLIVHARADQENSTCSTDWCTSPDPRPSRSHDCTVESGTDEKCTCYRGSARVTSRVTLIGFKYVDYTCCEGGENVGENCGGHEDNNKTTLIVVGVIAAVCGIVAVVWTYAHFRKWSCLDRCRGGPAEVTPPPVQAAVIPAVATNANPAVAGPAVATNATPAIATAVAVVPATDAPQQRVQSGAYVL